MNARGRAGELGLVLAAFAIALAVAEIAVRLVAPRPLPSQQQIRSFVLEGMYRGDARAGFVPTPGFSGTIERTGIVTRFATSSLGLRGGEIGTKDRPRILALGDSFTWGWGVPQGEEWIHWTGREIERLGGPRTETLNAGVNGYGTNNALVRLEALGSRVSPDLVLLGFFSNDYTDNLLAEMTGAPSVYTVRDGVLFDQFSHDWLRENFLARESHLVRLASSAWETFRVERLGRIPSSRPVKLFTEEEFRRGMELSERWILELRDAAAKLGAGFAVIWLPTDVYVVNRSRPEDIPLQWELQRRVQAAGIPSLDLLPALVKEREPAGLYIPADGHFSVRGNRVAGRAVGKWIVERGFLGTDANMRAFTARDAGGHESAVQPQ